MEPGRSYSVKTGETLWGISGVLADNLNLSRHQAMLAIRDLNPAAFVNGDPNQLIAGAVLRLPEESLISGRSPASALHEFATLQSSHGNSLEATPLNAASGDSFRSSGSSGSSGGR